VAAGAAVAKTNFLSAQSHIYLGYRSGPSTRWPFQSRPLRRSSSPAKRRPTRNERVNNRLKCNTVLALHDGNRRFRGRQVGDIEQES
jgi:hypothetical protein